jgi:hypothetical protein
MPRIKRSSGFKIPLIASAMLVLTAIGTLIYYNDYMLNVQTNEASIDYYFSNQTPTVYNQTNSPYPNAITISCDNGGGTIDGDFTLNLLFLNATFSSQTSQPYGQSNSTYVSFRWILHKGDSTSKVVYYFINPDVSGFSMSLSITKNSTPMKTNAIYPCNLQYLYNATTLNFQLSNS